MTEDKPTTNRLLRHKLQSLGRRLDELEEATSKLHKAEDELYDLQDKIIQAEGSNSSLLGDVEALRKRVLKIEGKDEEVRKAEDLCRLVKEKLETEEDLTRELKAEIEHLQRRMAELEKLEEAFGKSKSDCAQLCLSLNEEKNLTKKLSSELEALKARVKEVDSSEARLNRAEQALTAEMEKLKALTQTFVAERKRLLEKQREDEKIILKLTEKLERQKVKLGSSDHSFSESRDIRIEDDISAGLASKLARKKSQDYLKLSDDVGLRNKSENEKNSLEGHEDNKVKDLTQEVEKLKSRLKQLEMVEENLKNTETKNSELTEKFQEEKSRNQVLSDQLEQLRIQLFSSSNGNLVVSNTQRVLENGKADNEEINVRGGFRQEKPKYRSAIAEPSTSKSKTRETSPQQRRVKNKDLSPSVENSPKTPRRAQSPSQKYKKPGLKTGSSNTADNGLKDGRNIEEKLAGNIQASSLSDNKKVSVLSRYPPAASDQKSVKSSVKSTDENKKSRVEKFARLYTGSDSESNCSDIAVSSSSKCASAPPPEKHRSLEPESLDPSQEATAVLSLSPANGSYTAYRSHVTQSAPSDHGSEGHSSASETESTGSKWSTNERESCPVMSVLGSRTSSKYPRYSRLQDSHSGGSSTRSSYDEEQHRALMMEGGSQEPIQTSSGIEIQRTCSPREALRSKAVIKPAVVEYDRKEMMTSGGNTEMSTNGKPKVSTKMTTSITFYPNDPSSSRTSSRSSSISSDPLSKERHTSTSNIVITPSADLRSSFSIPYEISIPKSELTLQPGEEVNNSDSPSVLETTRVEASVLSRSSFSPQSPEVASDFNSPETGFDDRNSSTTTTVTSWRSITNSHPSQDNSGPEMRNVTIRSSWRNRGAASVDELSRGQREDGSEDESESTTTWRAYRATTVLEADENSPNVPTRCLKPSPAEVYMRRINSGNTTKDVQDTVRKSKSVVTSLDSSLQRCIPHEPVTAQQLQPRTRKQPSAGIDGESSVNSWRKQSELDSSESRSAWASRRRHWNSRNHDN